MLGIGKAPGKIILMGEHAVVYGKKAIAMPFFSVQIRSTTSYEKGPITISSACYDGELETSEVAIFGIKTLIEKTLEYLDQPIQNLHIKIESTIPPQRGLGSSAAVSISVVRSLFDYFDEELSHDTLTELVFHAENIHHHNPSGLDATTIIEENFLIFEKGKKVKKVTSKLKGYLIVSDTGEIGNTKESVANVQKNLKKNKHLIDVLGALSEKAIPMIEEGDNQGLGDLMNQAHSALNSLGVSNQSLNALTEVARLHGALGAKLTGGGNGGCLVALSNTLVEAKIIADALLNNGAQHSWIYHLKEDEYE